MELSEAKRISVAKWASLNEKYPVHSESINFFANSLLLGIKPFNENTLEGNREAYRENTIAQAGEVEFEGSESEIFVASSDVPNGIPISVYRPSVLANNPAIFIFVHGGGFVLGERSGREVCLKRIADLSGSIAVNVEYRLLPQDNVMAPVDDLRTVVKWINANKDTIGAKSESKVGIGGDSAGAVLCKGVTHQITGIDFQILIYPAGDLGQKYYTEDLFKETPGFSPEAVKWMISTAFSKGSLMDKSGAINSELKRSFGVSNDVAVNCPPALILLAEFDVIRGGGEAYAQALVDAGVSSQLEIIKGVPHMFFPMAKTFKTKAEEAYQLCAGFIKKFQ